MQNSKFKILYEDEDIRVIDKPAGLNSDDIEGRAHRLDKDTSGVLLTAKNDKTLEFLQRQFQERKTKKKYFALVTGHLKDKEGAIETLLGRSPADRMKQKVYLPQDPKAQRGKSLFAEGKRETGAKYREAVTRYKVLQRFKNYDLIEAEPLTGRKHQIRAHLAHLGHPISGDKLYGFKNQLCPEGLKRQFLHASYLKIELPRKGNKEFQSELPKDLKEVLEKIVK
jgi:23S rRNA pseudouridine1911/1915/1917 synthase